MIGVAALTVSFASFVAAQQISFAPGTGIRSLWIPFQTVTGTPVASISARDESKNVTVYVISCPTAVPQCAIAPNITLTEGPSTVRYELSNTAGAATLNCIMDGTTAATCQQAQRANGNINKVTSTLAASQISYQAVNVISTLNNTSTLPVTVTVTANSTTTSSTSTSTAGVQTSGPWRVGGAIGAGVLALAAL